MRDAYLVEAHLETCPDCREYLAEMRALVDAADRGRAPEVPARLRREFVTAFRDWAAA